MTLSVSDLSYSYGTKTALKDVAFDVAKGQFAALLGPNGAGKSTLFALLTRLFVSRTGTLQIAGHDLDRDPKAALASMGVVFQQSTLDLDLTVHQNLAYFAALQGVPRADVKPGITDALTRMDMGERAHEKVRNLNGGHRRRTEIARALLHNPKVLLLDEPTVGLDAGTRSDLVKHIHDLCRETGVTVLWATHLVDEVMPQDQVIVLHQGQVLRDEPCTNLCQTQPLADVFADLTQAPA